VKHEHLDYRVGNRVYFIYQGNRFWSVSDVTRMRNAPEEKTCSQLLKEYPSRWVAFAKTKKKAIEAAERDAKAFGQ